MLHSGSSECNSASQEVSKNPANGTIDKRGKYKELPHTFIDCHAAKLRPFGALVLLAIYRRTNSQHECRPSAQGIAKLLGISKRKVVDEFHRLQQLGYISVQEIDGKPSIFRVNVDSIWNGDQCTECTGANGAPVQSTTQTGANGASHRCNPRHRPVHAVHPKEIKKGDEERRLEKERRPADQLAELWFQCLRRKSPPEERSEVQDGMEDLLRRGFAFERIEAEITKDGRNRREWFSSEFYKRIIAKNGTHSQRAEKAKIPETMRHRYRADDEPTFSRSAN